MRADEARMRHVFDDPLLVTSFVLGMVGVLLLVQSRMQIRMLRRRVVSGAGTAIIDPVTGLFSAAAAWQSIRGEANRARRLERALEIRVGRTDDEHALTQLGTRVADALPPGATGVRVARDAICVVTCTASRDIDTALAVLSDVRWSGRSIAPDEQAETGALAFLSEHVG